MRSTVVVRSRAQRSNGIAVQTIPLGPGKVAMVSSASNEGGWPEVRRCGPGSGLPWWSRYHRSVASGRNPGSCVDW